MLTLFRASTGEDWQELLVLCYEGEFGQVGAVAYWFTFVGLTLFVVMNMFVMVIANYFEQAENGLDEYMLLRNFRRVSACVGGCQSNIRPLLRSFETKSQLPPDKSSFEPVYAQSYIHTHRLAHAHHSHTYTQSPSPTHSQYRDHTS